MHDSLVPVAVSTFDAVKFERIAGCCHLANIGLFDFYYIFGPMMCHVDFG